MNATKLLFLAALLAALLSSCAKYEHTSESDQAESAPTVVESFPPPPAPIAAAPAPPPPPRPSESSQRPNDECRNCMVARPPARPPVRTDPLEMIEPAAGPQVPPKPISEWPIFGQLSSAEMAFVVPDRLRAGEGATAQLVIDPTSTAEALERVLTEEGQVGSGTVQVSKIVVAKLVAPDGIEIKNISPERQAIDFSGPTWWEWQITPSQEGEFEVNLTISAVITVGSDSAERHIRAFRQKVIVYVEPADKVKSFFVDNWEWLISTLLLPLGLWLWSERKKKK